MSGHLDSFGAGLNQSQFFRMFALGCFDSFTALPINIVDLVSSFVRTGPSFRFYQGWTVIHSDWEPVLFPKSAWSTVTWDVFGMHWVEWVNPFLATVFFALFGLTPEARKGYRRFFRFIGKSFGVKQAESVKESFSEMFGDSREANTTAMSNISTRYCLNILSARKHLLTLL